ncbi:hypothetical protein [Paenibacillus sp. BAC0078]
MSKNKLTGGAYTTAFLPLLLSKLTVRASTTAFPAVTKQTDRLRFNNGISAVVSEQVHYFLNK